MIGVIAVILQCIVGAIFLFGLAGMATLPILRAIYDRPKKYPRGTPPYV